MLPNDCAALNRPQWLSSLKFWGNNIWKKHDKLPRALPFDVIAVGYFSTRSGCHIQFQVHMQAHTYTYSEAWHEDELCLCAVRSRVQTIIVSLRIILFFPPQKKSVMDNRLSNQVGERKPIGIKTQLYSHQALTTVPGAWLEETQTLWLYSCNHLLAVFAALRDEHVLKELNALLNKTEDGWKQHKSTVMPAGFSNRCTYCGIIREKSEQT